MDFKSVCGPRCKVHYTNQEEANYLLLNGGCVVAPDDSAFHAVYRKCLHGNIDCYVVEKRTPVFKFFIDMDFVASYILTTADWREVMAVLQERMKHCYPDKAPSDLIGIICTTTPKPKESEWHTGAHLHWPGVRVDSTNARKLRRAMIRDLEYHFGDNNWSTVFDAAVYQTSGLRMKGSKKMVRCEKCGGKKTGCDACRRGRVTDNRVWPTTVMTVEGVVDQSHPEPHRRLCGGGPPDDIDLVYDTRHHIRSRPTTTTTTTPPKPKPKPPPRPS